MSSRASPATLQTALARRRDSDEETSASTRTDDVSTIPRALFASSAPSSLVPPINFAMVMPGIYRSGYFNTRNYEFMEKCLHLRSVLNLSDDYSPHKIGVENLQWARSRSMNVFLISIGAFKEPWGYCPESTIARALSILVDVRNHPILVHDDKGKHRAGVLFGCLRKLQGYSLASIFHEAASFSHGSVRLLDMQYVENFSHPVPCVVEFLPSWLEIDKIKNV